MLTLRQYIKNIEKGIPICPFCNSKEIKREWLVKDINSVICWCQYCQEQWLEEKNKNNEIVSVKYDVLVSRKLKK